MINKINFYKNSIQINLTLIPWSVLNCFSHKLHLCLYLCSSCWLAICFFRALAVVETWPQVSQRFSTSVFVCKCLTCCCNWLLQEYHLLQNVHCCGIFGGFFSPVCVYLWCLFKCDVFLKLKPHWSHMYGLSVVCVFEWIFKHWAEANL